MRKQLAFCIAPLFLRANSVIGFSTLQLPSRSYQMTTSTISMTKNQEEVVNETRKPITRISHSQEFISTRGNDGKDAITLTSLINSVYAVGEKDIILDTKENPFQRMTLEETEKLLNQDKFLLLSIKIDEATEEEEKIIGCIKVDIKNDPPSGINSSVGEWGCLAVHTDYRGKGYATLLVQAAEQFFKSTSCLSVQLELLSPTNWKHPHKERLRSWYTSSSAGYCLKAENDYDASTTRISQGGILGDRFALLTDADFTMYTKPL